MAEITVEVGEQEFDFDVSVDDYNDYINALSLQDKVAPAHNLLMRTIHAEQKDALKEVVLLEGKPNGLVVAAIAGTIAADMGGEIKIAIKKRSK